MQINLDFIDYSFIDYVKLTFQTIISKIKVC